MKKKKKQVIESLLRYEHAIDREENKWVLKI